MMYIADSMPRSNVPPTPAASTTPGARAAADPDSQAQYTIDELAALARVPSRTIRFYQSKGALSSPEIRGRVAYYGAAHVERLKLIAQLQDRGLRMRAIRDLLARADKGELAITAWLGFDQQLQAPWADDRARLLSEAELNAFL